MQWPANASAHKGDALERRSGLDNYHADKGAMSFIARFFVLLSSKQSGRVSFQGSPQFSMRDCPEMRQTHVAS
jgi:hypothetical protein